jgi:hypothetical protein
MDGEARLPYPEVDLVMAKIRKDHPELDDHDIACTQRLVKAWRTRSEQW